MEQHQSTEPKPLGAIPTVHVLGVALARLPVSDAVDRVVAGGGLVLAPSGPGLCDLPHDRDYRDALLQSDLNLTDSGLVILWYALRYQEILPRSSGLGYLEELLDRPEMKGDATTFWVMPSQSSMERNLTWLRGQGFEVSPDSCYVAPMYPRTEPVKDDVLRRLLMQKRPAHVFVCVGSGPQEKLGLYLQRELGYRPGIHCIGAAIGFLSGDQSPIPRWADRLLLGWLLRCINDPKRYVPRYARATKLVYLLLRYGSESPPPATQSR